MSTLMERREQDASPMDVETDDVCWICLDNDKTGLAHELLSPCKCPRKVHPRCMARWQLQQAGRAEETQCRFCGSQLADWKTSLTPDALKPEVEKVQPIMVVYFEGEIHRIPVRQGDEGLKEFTTRIRELFKLPTEVDISLTFGCKEPMSGHHLKLEGMGAFDAAVHCASVAAAERQHKASKRNTREGDLPGEGGARPEGAPDSSDEGEDTTDLLQSTLGGPIQRPFNNPSTSSSPRTPPFHYPTPTAAQQLATTMSAPTMPPAAAIAGNSPTVSASTTSTAAGTLPSRLSASSAAATAATTGLPYTPRSIAAAARSITNLAGAASAAAAAQAAALAAQQAMRHACGVARGLAGLDNAGHAAASAGSMSSLASASSLTSVSSTTSSHHAMNGGYATMPSPYYHPASGIAPAPTYQIPSPAAVAAAFYNQAAQPQVQQSVAFDTPLPGDSPMTPRTALAPWSITDPFQQQQQAQQQQQQEVPPALVQEHIKELERLASRVPQSMQNLGDSAAMQGQEADAKAQHPFHTMNRNPHATRSTMDLDVEVSHNHMADAATATARATALSMQHAASSSKHQQEVDDVDAPADAATAAGQLKYDVAPHVISRNKLNQVLSMFGIRPPMQYSLGSTVQMDE